MADSVWRKGQPRRVAPGGMRLQCDPDALRVKAWPFGEACGESRKSSGPPA